MLLQACGQGKDVYLHVEGMDFFVRRGDCAAMRDSRCFGSEPLPGSHRHGCQGRLFLCTSTSSSHCTSWRWKVDMFLATC